MHRSGHNVTKGLTKELDQKDAAQLLWDEWKFRHELWWTSFTRWTGVIVGLWIIPFIKPKVFKPLPKVMLAFPVLALILSIFSMWHLEAEYRRLKAVAAKYDELRGDFRPQVPKNSRLDKLFTMRIGTSIVLAFGITFAIVSVLLWMVIFFVLLPN